MPAAYSWESEAQVARPSKEGLEYFSIDIDIMDEDSVGYIDAKYGVKAFGLLVRLLMKIYRNGYYTAWTEREQYLFTKDINVDIEETKNIVNAYINEGFFNQKLFKQYGILTSHGIQKRYIKACDRRSKIVMYQEYFLINPTVDDIKLDNVTLISINVDNNPHSPIVNDDIVLAKTPQSKVKESKEKKIESKEPSIRAREGQPVDNSDGRTDEELYPSGNDGSETPSPADDSSVESSPDFMAFWNFYPRRSGMSKAMEAWSELMTKNINPADLVSAARKYSLKVKNDKIAEQYIKMPHRFLADGVFKDYAPKYLHDCPYCHGTGYEPSPNGDNSMVECRCKKRFDAA